MRILMFLTCLLVLPVMGETLPKNVERDIQRKEEVRNKSADRVEEQRKVEIAKVNAKYDALRKGASKDLLALLEKNRDSYMKLATAQRDPNKRTQYMKYTMELQRRIDGINSPSSVKIIEKDKMRDGTATVGFKVTARHVTNSALKIGVSVKRGEWLLIIPKAEDRWLRYDGFAVDYRGSGTQFGQLFCLIGGNQMEPIKTPYQLVQARIGGELKMHHGNSRPFRGGGFVRVQIYRLTTSRDKKPGVIVYHKRRWAPIQPSIANMQK